MPGPSPTPAHTRDSVHARRLTAQLLAGAPARDPLAVAERLLAIQGQDPRGARLAVRARSRDVSSADVDRALTDERSLLITWLNRGTLHLIRSEDYSLLHLLTTPQLRTSSSTRLAQEGLDARATERALAVIERTLGADGPRTRRDLAARLQQAGIRTEGQALIQLMFRAGLDGIAIRGPMIGRQHAYVLVRDWLPPQPRLDRDRALAELARRYLAGHGPADARDLARWAGISLRDARAGLEAIATELRIRPDGLAELAGGRAAPAPPPRLLGAFEPLLLGWSSREPVLGEHASRVVLGGVFRGFALAGGRAVAIWRLHDERVELEPFTALEPSVTAALADDAHAVRRFLGLA
ncbi:MAG TPA: winged helix DNA-binding domain-containing protein [Solirubrobacteraceae bacterium]